VEVIEGNERGDSNVKERAWCVEREEANSTMGEAEIVRLARGEAIERVCR
jgi:hypothetical protein